jgi:hypothetical protein
MDNEMKALCTLDAGTLYAVVNTETWEVGEKIALTETISVTMTMYCGDGGFGAYTWGDKTIIVYDDDEVVINTVPCCGCNELDCCCED